MSKIIRSHIECGHRVGGLCYYGTSIDSDIIICKPTIVQNFPDNCPLEDGMSMSEHIKDILAMHKKPGTLYSTVHKVKNLKKLKNPK